MKKSVVCLGSLRVFVVVCLLVFGSFSFVGVSVSGLVSVNQGVDEDPLEVLFIGSSYFNYNHLPDLFSELCVSADKPVFVDGVIHNGWYLENHVNSAETQEKIAQRSWDVVVLQGVGTNCAYPDHFTDHPLLPALESLCGSIWQANADAKILYCMPWAFEDGMTWYQNWTDDFVAMQDKIFSNTLNVSSEVGCCIAPVGWAWKQVLVDYDFPLHFLHMSDWNHPSVRGSYLMGAVIFSSIFVKSCVGLDFVSDLNVSEARYFQQVASDVVLQNLSLWNLFSDEWVYVDDDNVQGPHLGSLEYPFCCIADGIAACERGGTVFVYGGLYDGGIVVEKPLSLVGEGAEVVCIDGHGIGDALCISSSDVSFKGFCVCNVTGSALFCEGNCDGLVVSDCVFESCAIASLLSGCTDVLLKDNVFSSATFGLCLDGVDGCVVEGNVFCENSFGCVVNDSFGPLGICVSGNDFLSNGGMHASFSDAKCVWEHNFWDDDVLCSPWYVIKGKRSAPFFFECFFVWFQLDRCPSSQPNCVWF